MPLNRSKFLIFLTFVSLAQATLEAGYIEKVRDGAPPAVSRILSGYEASPGLIPHQLQLRIVDDAGTVGACGGSVIHPQWGLTAAHCVAMMKTIVVRAGTTNLTRPGYIFETSVYYTPPGFEVLLTALVQQHDIGLIDFQRTLTYSETLQPIRLQRAMDKDKDYGGLTLVASGWGRLWTVGETPEILNWVYLTGLTHEECAESYGAGSHFGPSTFCTTYYNVTSQSTCQGDSGGPLTYVEEDGVITLVGVASFVATRGCHVALPAGFIRPGYYQDWYAEVTGIDFNY